MKHKYEACGSSSLRKWDGATNLLAGRVGPQQAKDELAAQVLYKLKKSQLISAKVEPPLYHFGIHFLRLVYIIVICTQVSVELEIVIIELPQNTINTMR